TGCHGPPSTSVGPRVGSLSQVEQVLLRSLSLRCRISGIGGFFVYDLCFRPTNVLGHRGRFFEPADRVPLLRGFTVACLQELMARLAEIAMATDRARLAGSSKPGIVGRASRWCLPVRFGLREPLLRFGRRIEFRGVAQTLDGSRPVP